MMRHKYHAVRCEYDGLKFPSKKEGQRYQELKLMRDIGTVVMFLRQPSFDIPGGVKYSADFLVFWADGNVSVEDVKGVQTKEFIRNKKIVEALYPVKIEVI